MPRIRLRYGRPAHFTKLPKKASFSPLLLPLGERAGGDRQRASPPPSPLPREAWGEEKLGQEKKEEEE